MPARDGERGSVDAPECASAEARGGVSASESAVRGRIEAKKKTGVEGKTKACCCSGVKKN